MHLNSKPEAERHANLHASEVAERYETASPSVAGRGGHAIGAAADTSAQVNKSEAEHAATAKGNARAEGRAQRCEHASRRVMPNSAFSMKIQLRTILAICGPLHAA